MNNLSYLLKWNILKRKGPDDYASYMTNWVQASEFNVYDAQNNKIPWPENTIVTASISGKEEESPSKLIDGDISTKWAVDTKLKTQEVNIDVIFTLPEKIPFTQYTYVTANDVPKRDPSSWKLYESLDAGESWIVLDRRTDIEVTDDRKTETSKFAINRVVQDIEIFTGLISLFRGDTYQLQWSFLPEDATIKDVIFNIADPSVCTITPEGLITATGNGRTEVTISSVSNPNVSKTFWVASTVVVTSVELAEHTLQLSVGDTHTINTTINPEDASDKRLTWECWNWDNPCITIDPDTGLITAIADGEDTVYVSAKSNFNAFDECAVRVWTDVQSISVLPAQADIGIGQDITFNYYVFPANASNPDVTITLDTEGIISLENGVITGLAEGTAIITVSSIDNPNISTICQINVFSEKEPDESDYNSNGRIIQWKADIYFDGKDKEPLTITKDNYLIDADLLEETSSDSKTPFGNVSSNEFNMTLLNENGMFSPTREDSPYYGKIKKGVPIHVFCKPSDKDYVTWEEFGWFYVTDWTAAITGIKADITANDQLYNIFDMPKPKLPVQANKTFAQAYQEFFDALQEQVRVDESLTETLKYFYNTRENKDFLSEISTGAQAYVYCDRDGIPKVQYSRIKQEVAHTLTDSDQIISISSKQSAILDYDGAEVVMNMPQESDIETLLSVKSLTLPVGKYTSAITNFSKKPVFKVTAAFLTGVENAHVTDIIATCMDVIYEVQNDAGKEITNALEILGTFIDIISTNFADEGNNLLKIDNDYVQTEDYAQKFRIFLRAYVFNKVPVLELSIRGNVKYKLGEKLHVISERYAVDFTGVLIRQNFHYDGGMSCTIKLLNSEILEV